MHSKMYCPICGKNFNLVFNEANGKWDCPTLDCKFIDSRKGWSCVPDEMDRRGKKKGYIPGLEAWGQVKWKK